MGEYKQFNESTKAFVPSEDFKSAALDIESEIINSEEETNKESSPTDQREISRNPKDQTVGSQTERQNRDAIRLSQIRQELGLPPSNQEPQNSKTEINPGIRNFFRDLGEQEVAFRLSKADPRILEIIKKDIREGNVGGIIHFMGILKEPEPGEYDEGDATLDFLSDDPVLKKRGIEGLDKIHGDFWKTANKYDSRLQSPEAVDILNQLFR